jgi:hypothetical protein
VTSTRQRSAEGEVEDLSVDGDRVAGQRMFASCRARRTVRTVRRLVASCSASAPAPAFATCSADEPSARAPAKTLVAHWWLGSGESHRVRNWKGAVSRDFLEGERRDSNPRPPGPQPGDPGVDRSDGLRRAVASDDIVAAVDGLCDELVGAISEVLRVGYRRGCGAFLYLAWRRRASPAPRLSERVDQALEGAPGYDLDATTMLRRGP